LNKNNDVDHNCCGLFYSDRNFNFWRWVESKFFVGFDQNLPLGAIGDLPDKLKYFIGTLGYFLILIVFLYFLIREYEKGINTKFMSLDSNSGNCKEVELTVSATSIYADYNGHWRDSSLFRPELAMYSINVQNFKRSTGKYRLLMGEIEAELKLRAATALVSDPARNLLVWMSWHKKAPDYFFQMTGDPRVVFGREHQAQGLASAAGVCDVHGLHGFDFGSGHLYSTYPINAFMASSVCTSTWSPSAQGYIPQLDGPITRVEFDVTSIITAIAVNN
jgi:hypothetical protein